MPTIEELKERMDRAAEIEDPLDRRLWVLAVITEALMPSGVKPILVGGAAVEFYTSGGYVTFDVDVVVETQPLGVVMAKLGFTKSGRHWLREDISIALEAPSSSLADGFEKIFTLEIEGMKIYIIGVEDLIIDRLNAYQHWQSSEDGRWAEHLIDENKEQIDWEYLTRRASQEGTKDALDVMLKSLEESNK